MGSRLLPAQCSRLDGCLQPSVTPILCPVAPAFCLLVRGLFWSFSPIFWSYPILSPIFCFVVIFALCSVLFLSVSQSFFFVFLSSLLVYAFWSGFLFVVWLSSLLTGLIQSSLLFWLFVLFGESWSVFFGWPLSCLLFWFVFYDPLFFFLVGQT